MEKQKISFFHLLSHFLLAGLIFIQVGLVVIFYDRSHSEIIRNIGWIILFISAFFGWLPIFEFRRKGEIPKGQSFVKTTKLVKSGVYRIVRHPQFLAGILLGLALILVGQHWLITIIGLPIMILFYLGIVEGDKEAIKKFGQDYKNYMKKVPQMNFFLGIFRLLRKNS